MDALTVQRLTFAWMRRRRWESNLLAGEIVSLLGKAMGSKGRDPTAGGAAGGKMRVSGGEMLAMMGVQF